VDLPGSMIHVWNTLLGMQNLRKPVGSEQYVYSGGQLRSHEEAIGTCNLILSSNFNLVLEKPIYFPNFLKNLISVSRLAPLDLSFN
jgi:hypothetical protein